MAEHSNPNALKLFVSNCLSALRAIRTARRVPIRMKYRSARECITIKRFIVERDQPAEDRFCGNPRIAWVQNVIEVGGEHGGYRFRELSLCHRLHHVTKAVLTLVPDSLKVLAQRCSHVSTT